MPNWRVSLVSTSHQFSHVYLVISSNLVDKLNYWHWPDELYTSCGSLKGVQISTNIIWENSSSRRSASHFHHCLNSSIYLLKLWTKLQVLVFPLVTSAFSNNAEPSHSIQISNKRPRISRTSSNTCHGFSTRPSEPLFNLLRFPHLLKQPSNRNTDPQIVDFSLQVLRSPASNSLPLLIEEKTTTS